VLTAGRDRWPPCPCATRRPAHVRPEHATAKTHVNRAMVKLGARDRAQLVVVAYQSGLVHPLPPDAATRFKPSDPGRVAG